MSEAKGPKRSVGENKFDALADEDAADAQAEELVFEERGQDDHDVHRAMGVGVAEAPAETSEFVAVSHNRRWRRTEPLKLKNIARVFHQLQEIAGGT